MVNNPVFHFYLNEMLSSNFILLFLFISWQVYIFGFSCIFWVLSLLSVSHQELIFMKPFLFLNYGHIFLMHFEYTVLKLLSFLKNCCLITVVPIFPHYSPPPYPPLLPHPILLSHVSLSMACLYMFCIFIFVSRMLSECSCILSKCKLHI